MIKHMRHNCSKNCFVCYLPRVKTNDINCINVIFVKNAVAVLCILITLLYLNKITHNPTQMQ